MIFFRANKFLLIFSLVLCFLSACNNKKEEKTDLRFEPQQGTIRICVDESFKPIISQQIYVFEASFPKAHIIVNYESEAECFRNLDNDSVNMVIVARAPTQAESNYYKDKLGHWLHYSVLAFDAVSMIVNNNATDSIFTLQEVKNMLTTKEKSTQQIVLDGENATSTVRYLLDSVTRGTAFGINVSGVENSQRVLDLVARDKNLIGFVGSSWIGNKVDSAQKADLKNIRLAFVESPDTVGIYAKPSQGTLYKMLYPYYRTVYGILKDNYTGLGSSFYNFMSYQRGQLIFRRGGLVPAKMNFTIRTVKDFAAKEKEEEKNK